LTASVIFTVFGMTLVAQQAIAALPIAEIQLLGEAQVGSDVRLASIGANVPAVNFSWQLDQRPKSSKAKISDTNSAQTSFLPDVSGIYVVQLTVRLRDLSATKTLAVYVDVEPTPAATGPLVPVNTIDTSQSPPAITIGPTSYQPKGNGVQVVVLDRNTLSLITTNVTSKGTVSYNGNQTYSLSTSQMDQMGTDLGGLPKDGSRLVLVSFLAGQGQTISSDVLSHLSTALNKIGGVIPEAWASGDTNAQLRTCWSSMQMQCYNNNPVWHAKSTGWNGSFSVIGVPGMAIGNAWYDDAQQHPAAGGALVGYLTPSSTVTQSGALGNGTAYSFVFGPEQYAIVDTCATGAPQSCVINVSGYRNGQPYLQTYPPKNGVQNGMTVVLLDRVTLNTLLYDTVTDTAKLYSDLFYAGTWPSGHFFYGPFNANPVSDRTIAILQSVGNGLLPLKAMASGDSGTALLQVIDQLGGTPETFGQKLQLFNGAAGPGPYALVGVASDLPWHGKAIESSPIISSALGCATSACTQPGRSRGVLSRDRYGRYTPTTFDPIGTAILDMASIVYQPPKPWPNQGSCGVKWIAQGLNFPTDSAHEPLIRSDYYGDTFVHWDEITATSVGYPDAIHPLPPGFCPSGTQFPDDATYKTIQLELDDEFTWVSDTITLIEDLSNAILVAKGATETIVSGAASAVYNSIPPKTASTTIPWEAIADLAFAIGATPLGSTESGMVGVMVASITLGTDLSTNTSSAGSAGNPAKKILAQTTTVVEQLEGQMEAYDSTLTTILEKILLDDYGKLSFVGQNIANKVWTWNNDIAMAAISAINATTTQVAYSALLPKTWPLVELKPDLVTQFQSQDVVNFLCTHPVDHGSNVTNDPFGHVLGPNQFESLFQLVGITEHPYNYEVWTWAIYDIYTSFTDRPGDTTFHDQLFLPSTDAAGAGAYPPAWFRSTYNPPDFVRCGSTSANPSTEQHPAAPVSPTEAGYTLG
jgi:hypothetical protein